MEKSLTQRMDWLHTWFGLVLGWLAFALFLTGTIAVFWFEIQHWAQTELHGAKIMTVGERAEDVFYVTDESGRPLDEARRKALADALQRALGPREAAA